MPPISTWFRRRGPNQIAPAANVAINVVFLLYAVACLAPLLVILSISFSTEGSILKYGYSLFPKEFSAGAYKLLFKDSVTIVAAYKNTVLSTLFAASLCVVTVCLYAYPLSRRSFKFKKFFTFYLFLTMIFNGGLVASYIVNTSILGLRNNFWVMVFPGAFNAFWVIVMRTFYKTQIPESLIESAKIDGSTEWNTLFKVVLPLALPGIATVALFSTIGTWNDFFANMLYIDQMGLYNLQRLIQQMLNSITVMREMAFKVGTAGGSVDMSQLPSETLRMAVCIVTIGPIMLAYPFFQKFFISGLTIGAIKE